MLGVDQWHHFFKGDVLADRDVEVAADDDREVVPEVQLLLELADSVSQVEFLVAAARVRADLGVELASVSNQHHLDFLVRSRSKLLPVVDGKANVLDQLLGLALELVKDQTDWPSEEG